MTDKELSAAQTRFETRIASLEGDTMRCFWDIKDAGAPGYAYFPAVMYTFATIDYFSAFWAGWSDSKIKKDKIDTGNLLLKPDKRGQTKRMSDFMEEYLGYGQKESQIGVKVWRHSLMHTGEPKILRETITNPNGQKTVNTYYWSTGLNQPGLRPNMVLDPLTARITNEFYLAFYVLDCVRDLRHGIFGTYGYFEDLSKDPYLQALHDECLQEFENAEFIPIQ